MSLSLLHNVRYTAYDLDAAALVSREYRADRRSDVRDVTARGGLVAGRAPQGARCHRASRPATDASSRATADIAARRPLGTNLPTRGAHMASSRLSGGRGHASARMLARLLLADALRHVGAPAEMTGSER